MSILTRWGVALAVVCTVAVAGCTAGGTRSDGPAWSASWSAAPQRPSIGFGPNWSEAGFSHQTLRQVVRLTSGGDDVRIRLSNRYGDGPLVITGASIGLAGTGAGIQPGSAHPLTFGTRETATIPPGGEITSDAAQLQVKPLESVTVTLYFDGTTGPATFHSQGWTDSYAAPGDHRVNIGGDAFTSHTESWYYLTDVEVGGRSARQDTVVAFGDSITDGFGSTLGTNNRWPDELADRLAGVNRQRAVLDEGIGGNLVLNDSAWYGDRAGIRFAHDVLDKPGVHSVIILEGVNDIGFSETNQPTYKPNPDVSAEQIIAGYQTLIQQAHARGIRVIGATLLPFGGSDHYSARSAAKRQAINAWIHTAGKFDAVVDFAAVVADPNNAEVLAPGYDSGDHLHPNDAGYRAMAQAIDPNSL